MNWKSAFIWTIIIFVIVVFAGYFYHDNRVEEAYSAGWNDSYLAGLKEMMQELAINPDPVHNFELGYNKGYLDGLKTRDAYQEGYDTGRDEGYAEGYDDAKAGFQPMR